MNPNETEIEEVLVFPKLDNVTSLVEVADFGKINLQLKNKYYAKRKRE